MITLADYQRIRAQLGDLGYGEEIRWQEKVGAPNSADEFAWEAIYVIVNSGMKAQVARGIYDLIMEALREGRSASAVFGHVAKCRAIDEIWGNRQPLFEAFSHMGTDDGRLAFLEELPHIGPITKYHLGKNFGLDVCKPDRHLVRLAAAEGCSPDELCQRLSRESGDRVPVVDLVLWRACNLGML